MLWPSRYAMSYTPRPRVESCQSTTAIGRVGGGGRGKEEVVEPVVGVHDGPRSTGHPVEEPFVARADAWPERERVVAEAVAEALANSVQFPRMSGAACLRDFAVRARQPVELGCVDRVPPLGVEAGELLGGEMRLVGLEANDAGRPVRNRSRRDPRSAARSAAQPRPSAPRSSAGSADRPFVRCA